MSAESELLMACLRDWTHPERPGRVASLVDSGIDWNAFLEMALLSGMVSVVHDVLCRPDSGIPDSARQGLDACFTANAMRTTWLTRKLLTLLDWLNTDGIRAIPVKGAVLGIQAYGNLFARHFDDLDILVKPADLYRAGNILRARGYDSALNLPDDVVRSKVLVPGAFHLFSHSGDHHVDIADDVCHMNYGAPGDAEWIWEEVQTVSIEGRDVPTLSTEALLVFLCVHGTKHAWYRPVWIADIVGLFRRNPAIDWPAVLTLSRRLAVLRMVLLGLEVVRRTVEIDLPEAVVRAIADDPMVTRLSGRICRDLLAQPGKPPHELFPYLLLNLLSRVRIRDRMRYTLIRIFKPTHTDWTCFRLPRRLHGLYYVTRPFRLILRHAPGLFLAGMRRVLSGCGRASSHSSRSCVVNNPPAPPLHRRWLFWVPLALTSLVLIPGGMMQCHYLPKTFWATVWLALGFIFLRPAVTGSRDTRHATPDTRSFTLTPLGAVWFAYSVWILISLTWAIQPRVSFERWLALLLPTLAYLLAKRTRFWESDAFWTFFCCLIGAIALLGIAQFARDYVARLFAEPFPGFARGYKAFVDWFPGGAQPRGTMGQRNVVSMYLVISLPFLAWRYVRNRGRQAFLACVVLGLGLLLVLLARTRGAWVGLCCAALGMVAAGTVLRLRAHVTRIAWLTVPALLAVVLALAMKPPESFEYGTKERLGDTVGKVLDPGSRVGLWRNSFGVTGPLRGAGFGNYPILCTARMPEEGVKVLAWEIHNDYLQAYLDLGIPGFALFTAAFGLMIRLAWKGRQRGLILAAGAAVVGLAAMQATSYTYEKVDSLVWFAGVVAILNSQPTVRPLFSKPVPTALSRVFDTVIVIGLLGFAVVVGFSIRGDRLFRRVEERACTWSRVPPAHREQARRAVRREIQWLYDTVLPSMQFGAKMRQVYCSLFGVYAVDCGDQETATGFVREALNLHPNNLDCIEYLIKRAFIDGRRKEGIALMERYVDTFGCNPDSDITQGLLTIYEMRSDMERASRLRERIAASTVTVPTAPSPANRASGVPVDVLFDWSDCGATESYQLYLWQTGEQAPKTPIARRIKESHYQPLHPLTPDTVYFWRVKAIGRISEKQTGIWFFRTEKRTSRSRPRSLPSCSRSDSLEPLCVNPRITDRHGVSRALVTDDIITLYEMKEQLKDAPEGAPSLINVLDERFAQGLLSIEPKKINRSLELVAFKWELLGEDPGEGEIARYQASCLLRSKAPAKLEPGQLVILLIAAYPDNAHRHYLSTEDRPDRVAVSCTSRLDIDDWHAGGCYMITRELDVPSIPYRVAADFQLLEDVNGQAEYQRDYAPRLQLGWHADVRR